MLGQFLTFFVALFSLIILTIVPTSFCLQSFSESPRNTSLKQGEDVMLKCVVKAQRGELVWCKDEFCTFGRRRNFTDPRFSIVGEEALGEHHLYIKNVSIGDSTKYQCQVTATDIEPAIRTDLAFLTVYVEPKTVLITSNNADNRSLIRLTTNVSTSIECISDSSNPGCDLLWFLNEVQLKTSTEVTFSPTLIQKLPTQLFKSTARINIKPSKASDWYQRELKCECSNQMTLIYNNKKSDKKSIVMNYAPIVKILKISQEELLPGNYIEFQCLVESEPPVKSYKWYIDSKVYSEGPDERFIFLKITEDMNNKLFKCDAKNDVATTTESYKLELLFAPKFIQEPPSHIVAKLNEQVTLSCDVASNPTPSIMWYLNKSLVYAYPKLVINSIRSDNYGLYKCEAAARDFPKISTTVLIVPPGPPIIEADPIQKAFYGYKGTLECVFEKEPKTQDIEWYQGNRRIDTNKEARFEIKNELVNRKGTKSSLIINEVSQADFTNYTCRGINSYGLTNRPIILEPKLNDDGSIFPITIICIFIFVACSVVVFIGYKKYFEYDKKSKRVRRPGIIGRDRYRARPNIALNPGLNQANNNRCVYPVYRFNNPNAFYKLKRHGAKNLAKNYHRRKVRLVQQKRPQMAAYHARMNPNRAFKVINPCLNQSNNLNTSVESFNYYHYEKQQLPQTNPENITNNVYYDEANCEQYLNAKFQTDV